jgi:hypothetical protein
MLWAPTCAGRRVGVVDVRVVSIVARLNACADSRRLRVGEYRYRIVRRVWLGIKTVPYQGKCCVRARPKLRHSGARSGRADAGEREQLTDGRRPFVYRLLPESKTV